MLRERSVSHGKNATERLPEIEAGRLLTEEELRYVRAALDLSGLSQRQFCQREELAYNYFSQVMNRRRVPNEREHSAIKRLIEEAPWP